MNGREPDGSGAKGPYVGSSRSAFRSPLASPSLLGVSQSDHSVALDWAAINALGQPADEADAAKKRKEPKVSPSTYILVGIGLALLIKRL